MKQLNETAHKILDTAESYTQSHGFNAFSYKDIQKEVGIKTSSIHYYFPSKHDLALSMTQRYIDRFKKVLNIISLENSNGIEKLGALANIYKNIVAEGKFCMCGMLASDMLALPESVNNKLKEFFLLTENWITEVIERAKEQDEFKASINANNAASHFLSAMEGAMLIARIHGNTQYLDTVVDEALNRLKN